MPTPNLAPVAPQTGLRIITEALTKGFDGATLPLSGLTLSADFKPESIDKISEDRLPFLWFDIGNIEISEWKGWEDYFAWDIPAALKVRGEPGAVKAVLLDVVHDIANHTKKLIGLPVDESGNVVPYNDKTASMFDKGQVFFLAERGAPFFKSARATSQGGPFATAQLVFRVETTLNLDPRTGIPIAETIILGTNYPPGTLAADSTLPDPFTTAVITDQNRTGYTSPNTQDPQRRRNFRYIKGPTPQTQIQSVNAIPYSIALSVGTPTAQLSASATFQNWATQSVTGQAAWSSTNTGVATVSATGLVTRVAAGSCTVSCTFLGQPSNAVAVTVS